MMSDSQACQPVVDTFCKSNPQNELLLVTNEEYDTENNQKMTMYKFVFPKVKLLQSSCMYDIFSRGILQKKTDL